MRSRDPGTAWPRRAWLAAACWGALGARAGALASPSPSPPSTPASAAGGASAPLQPWQPMHPPVLQALDLATGQSRSLAHFAGRPLLVNFWATWCAPCRVEMPSLNQLADALGPQGLHCVFLNHGEMPQRVLQFLQEVPLRGTVLLDRQQTLLRAWGGRALPATFVFNAQGVPRLQAQGEWDWSRPDIVQVLRQLR